MYCTGVLVNLRDKDNHNRQARVLLHNNIITVPLWERAHGRCTLHWPRLGGGQYSKHRWSWHTVSPKECPGKLPMWSALILYLFKQVAMATIDFSLAQVQLYLYSNQGWGRYMNIGQVPHGAVNSLNCWFMRTSLQNLIIEVRSKNNLPNSHRTNPS